MLMSANQSSRCFVYLKYSETLPHSHQNPKYLAVIPNPQLPKKEKKKEKEKRGSLQYSSTSKKKKDGESK